MQTMELNDGTLLENSYAIQNGNVMWFYISGKTLVEAFALMNDPAKTATVTVDRYGAVTEISGYTDLFCIRRESDGMITGGLYAAG